MHFHGMWYKKKLILYTLLIKRYKIPMENK